eukprot:TRINITY_DN93464_c0_g1_i1.p1 TRINITY_DN93464_c0_g1~~TRINITY_DN93464_c0_g1_i1.p1  ORF type:complete len:224 (+),score=47.44 TRINITY_DN93464_c0_g1_i1:50-721(+)
MGCNSSSESTPPVPGRMEPNPENPVAEFETTMGSFKAEIFLDRTPITASNFIDLAQSGFYNGIHFHRVIADFMNQFGCPFAKDATSQKAGTGGPQNGTFKNLKTGGEERRFNGGCIKDEHTSLDSNVAGTLSMANTGKKDSGGSQFFINVADNKNLDFFSPGESRHPVFGRIVEGMELCVQISKVKTDAEDRPLEPIMMKGITIVMPEKGEAAASAKTDETAV